MKSPLKTSTRGDNKSLRSTLLAKTASLRRGCPPKHHKWRTTNTQRNQKQTRRHAVTTKAHKHYMRGHFQTTCSAPPRSSLRSPPAERCCVANSHGRLLQGYRGCAWAPEAKRNINASANAHLLVSTTEVASTMPRNQGVHNSHAVSCRQACAQPHTNRPWRRVHKGMERRYHSSIAVAKEWWPEWP